MTVAAQLPSLAHVEVDLFLPTWAFGLIALVIFLAMLAVLLSFRDVANRHRVPMPGADEHVTMPGATHHGDGHPFTRETS